MRIQLIRSATMRLTIEGRTFLIDPWLVAKGHGNSYAGKTVSPLVDLPMPVDQIVQNVDAVIVSHLHSDHWDQVARDAIRADMPILCHDRDSDHIRQQGFSDVRPLTGEIYFNHINVRVTEGRHGPPEVLPEMGSVSGFVFRTPNEPSLYWAGDTILCDEVRDVIAKESPDIIVVHACGANWDGIGPLVMDAEMTLETMRLAGRATVIASHLDAVDHATVTRSTLRSALFADIGSEKRLLIPEDGEVLTFEL